MPPTRKKTKRFITAITVITLIVLGWSLWQEWKAGHPAEPRRWKGFDVAVPRGYTIHGIDISHYQGRVHWPSVKAMKDKDVSLRFAFIKATEGIYNTDDAFEANWQQCRDCKLSRGAYHFFHPAQDPYLQAWRFILTVQLGKGDIPPVLDAEATDGLPPAVVRERICCWLNMVEAWYHVKPLVYTNISFYRENLKGHINEYPLWIAHYNVSYPHIDTSWTFWQYSEQGHVSGIDAYVDLNVFSGDSSTFASMLVE